LQLSVSGRVECWDDDTDSFPGGGNLIISMSEYVKRVIRVVVLGNIAGHGTAVLIDNEQNVWLYNVPESVDKRLKAMACQAAKILVPGDSISEFSKIKMIEEYTKATIEFDLPDDIW
jgi:hypothetical protein